MRNMLIWAIVSTTMSKYLFLVFAFLITLPASYRYERIKTLAFFKGAFDFIFT